MTNPSPFRIWLRRRRQERGLTQERLGELVGYSGQTIAKIEGGQRRPSPQLALRLAEALELPPDAHGAWMAAALADAEPEAAPTLVAPELPGPSAEPGRELPALPAFLTPFVGRGREQAELVALLGRPECRLVTLLGPGGVGKTRLAVETGRTIRGFSDGVVFVPLAPVAEARLIAPAIGEALGIAFSPGGDLLAQLVGHLRDQRTLLILDNLEQLLDPDGAALELLERLLAQAQGVSVLATSRERLRLAGEWVLELDGLPVPQADAQEQPRAAPALRLFAEHAERIHRGFRLTRDNEASIATICRMVDGLPLGIELAAAWTRMLSLDEIALELAHGRDAAQLSPRTLPPRHRSLHAVVDYSWQLLNADEREALRRLSVFQGGFTREAAAEVAGAGLGLLASLVDKSLLRRGPGGRCDFHEIIRQYAGARLQEHPDELAATRGRHAAYYLRLVGERDQRLKGVEQAAATAEIGAELDNVRAAWPWAAANVMLEGLERAGEVLHWFYEFRSWLHEGAALFAQGIELLRAAGPGGDSAPWERALARLLGHYGYLATRLGAFAQARAALDESAALLADGRDPLGLSRTLLNKAQLAHWSGDYGGARRALDQSLELAALTGDRQNRAMGLTVSSMAAHALGSYEEAEQLFRAALELWRQVGNPRGTVWCVTACAETLLVRGKPDEAQQLLRESLALSHAARDTGGTAATLYNLGHVAAHQGDLAEAIYFFREVLPMLRATTSLMYARALNDFGAALWRAGSKGEARRAYGEALTTALAIQVDHEALQALDGLATCLADAGRHDTILKVATCLQADPASRDGLRGAADALRRGARARLSEEEAARIEAQARGLSLAAALAELAPQAGAA